MNAIEDRNTERRCLFNTYLNSITPYIKKLVEIDMLSPNKAIKNSDGTFTFIKCYSVQMQQCKQDIENCIKLIREIIFSKSDVIY